ncbi:MAG: 4-alpha-glucanotransferase [Ferrimonas sp.]
MLDKLFYLQGVGSQFIDCDGVLTAIPTETRIQLLRCMVPSLFDANGNLDSAAVSARVEQLDVAPWTEPLPAWQCCAQQAPKITVYAKEKSPLQGTFTLLLEHGEQRHWPLTSLTVEQTGDYVHQQQRYVRWQFSIPDQTLPLGYHQLYWHQREGHYAGQFVLTPQYAFAFPKSRGWGLLIGLYSLRSEGNWGIGDFGDLQRLIRWSAPFGVDFIQLSPLHALSPQEPQQCSPYRPLDRRYLSPLYIDINALIGPEWLQQKLTLDQQQQLQALRTVDWLDFTAVAELKMAVLALYFAEHQAIIEPQLAVFVAAGGKSLWSFATMQAQGLAGHQADPHFHLYLQFIATQQLAECQSLARAQGMAIGLVRDLAVGVAPEGSEVAEEFGIYCPDASIGAPPDPFALQGQNWGLTPFNPVELKRANYQQFIQLLRQNMRDCGALRMDHIMTINRLWWWAEKGHGGYVHYPQADLLALLCLESHRQKCSIIGEDLGTVAPELVGALEQSDICRNEVLYFFQDEQGFIDPNCCKKNSLMMLANHDVAPLAGWWQQRDLALRLDLGLLNTSEFESEQQLRTQHKRALLDYIGFASEQQDEALKQAWRSAWLERLMAKLAAGNARFIGIQLDDVIAETEPVNLPGTWQEYPNWQRRMRCSIEQFEQQYQQTMRALQRAAENGFKEA